MPFCSAGKAFYGLLIPGALLLIFGAICNPVMNSVLHSQINNALPVTSNTSTLFSEWTNPSGTVYMQYYFWNLLNAENVTYNQSKPEVVLIGPFTYIQVEIKTNVIWSPDLETASYEYTTVYYPITDNCTGPTYQTNVTCTMPYDTNITSINIPIVGLMAKLTALNDSKITNVFNTIMDFKKIKESDTLFVTHTANEWLFGYYDVLLEKLRQALEDLKMDPDKYLPSPFIQLQANDSLTASDPSIVYTGKGDVSKTLTYKQYAGNPSYMFNNITTGELLWNGCTLKDGPDYPLLNFMGSQINGSEGFQFAPFLTKSSTISVFSSTVMRSIELGFNSVQNLDGIELYRFFVLNAGFLNESSNIYNCAFSDFGPHGVLNFTAVAGAPIFASNPLFYLADDYYTSLLSGDFDANPEEHFTYLDVEPNTGATMRAHQRLQINVQVIPTPGLNLTQNLKTGLPFGFYVPVFYGDQNGQITPSLASQFKSSVGLALGFSKYGMIASLVVGGLLLVGALVAYVKMRANRSKNGAPHEYERLVNTDASELQRPSSFYA